MADSVTISLLPVSLSLVHIPRSRIQDLFHPILRQLLLPKPTFLNVTSNEIELSLFAEYHSLRDFEPIARHDAHRAKVIGLERSFNEEEDVKQVMDWQEWSPVEVSQDRWNVLQIDSHSDGLDTSGARVHELSAPLAAAGISILYQSSYMSDFIFVKEHRLSEVMALLGAAGFDLYSSDPEHLTSQLSTLTSPILSPISKGVEDDSLINVLDLSSTPNTAISTENGAVLTRSRSSTDASNIANIANSLKQSARGSTDPDSTESDNTASQPKPIQHREGTKHNHLYRSQSHSPSGCDVQVLDPDLTCIGLSDDNTDVWSLKILKLVAFPDLISGPHISPSTSPTVYRRPSLVASEMTPVTGLGVDIDETTDVLCAVQDGEGFSDSESETVGSRSDDTTRVGDSPIDGNPPIFDMEPLEDGTQEPDLATPTPHAILPDDQTPKDRTVRGAADDEETSALETTRTRRSRPLPTRLDMRDHPHPTSKPAHTASTSPKQWKRHRHRSHSLPPVPMVPFFSFTRTPEGSSLTAPVNMLASLFPASERHMVICSGELDVLDSRAASPMGGREGEDEEDVEEGSGRSGFDGDEQGTLKCLQIDLRKFGLDKHGLVNRYSRTLEENGINHMYSSTYKTANLLVDKAQARRAQSLLRSC